MGMWTRLWFAAGGLATLAYATAASADEAAGTLRLPVSYVERGLTLPKMILAPEVDFGVARLGGATLVNLTALAQFSILDDLTVRATVAPLQLSPTFYYGNIDAPGPTVGATYRFVRGEVEVGASVDLGVTAYQVTGVYFQAGLPVHVHFGTRARLDTGVFLPVQSFPGTTALGVNVPARLAVDIIEPLHVGVSTGFQIAELNPPKGVTVGNTAGVPLGIFGGYAIAGDKGPIVDIDPFFTWLAFISGAPGITNPDVKDFEVGVAVTGYIYL